MNTELIPAKLAAYFKDYASYHKHPGNKKTHYVGIPMIVFSILGGLSNIVLVKNLGGSELLQIDLGILLWAAASVWYFTLDARLATPFSLIMCGMYFAARTVAWPIHLALFVVGWIIQLYGHKIEGNKPAFFKSIEHLLIGPFWIFANITKVI